MGKRRAWVLLGVHLLILGHIVHWRLTGQTLSPLEPSEAMELTKHDMVNAGALFFAAAILSTALFGRFFCGWGCHILALQDLCGALLKKIGIRPQPLRSRVLIWVPILAFFYMFLWPALYRLWIGDVPTPKHLELTTTDFWATFPAWPVALLTFFVCGFVIVYFLGQKGFCTYACPYGGIFGAVDRLAPLRIRVSDACESCGHCTAVCTSNVRVHEEVRDYGSVVDPGCMKCLDCVAVCPNDALSLSWGAPAVFTSPRREVAGKKPQLRFWEEAVLAIAFVAALLSFRGLYGIFPFLLSLGLAAILSYLVLTTIRLVRRPNLRLRRTRLKAAGRLTSGGWAFSGLMLLVVAVWGHSAWIQWHLHRGLRAYGAVADLQSMVSAPDVETWELTATDRKDLEQTVSYLSPVADRGLLKQAELELRLAWMNLLLDHDQAFDRRLERAAKSGADPAILYSLRARQLVRKRDWGRAAQEYERAVVADPKRLWPHLGLGTLLAGLGDLEGASAAFERGLSHLPDEADLYYNAGLASALSGDPVRAIQRFGEALELNASHVAARENLAGVLAGLGRFRESLEHYREAVRTAPSDAETRLLMARVLLALDKPGEAEEQARLAAELDPESVQAKELLQSMSAQP